MSRSKVVISSYVNGKLIAPGDNVGFRVRGEESYFDPYVSNILSFKVPMFPKLITSYIGKYKKTYIKNYTVNSGTLKKYSFTGWAKYIYIYSRTKDDRDRLSLALSEEPTGLKVGDLITIKTDSVYLSDLDGNSYYIIASTTSKTSKGAFTCPITKGVKGKPAIDLNIEKDWNLASRGSYEPRGTLSSNNNYITTNISKGPAYKYSFTLPNFSLINQSYVKDVLILSYTKTADDPDITTVKYLINNQTLIQDSSNLTAINEQSPPNYESVSSRPSNITFIGSSVPIVGMYMAIARYTKRNNVWTGAWLQKDANNKVIWKKMTEDI